MVKENEDEIKSALKEALKEWLDEKFLQFGKWTLMGLAAALFAAIIDFILHMHGWTKISGGH